MTYRTRSRALPALLLGLALTLVTGAPTPAQATPPQVSIVVGFPPILVPAGPVVVVPGAPPYDAYPHYAPAYYGHGHGYHDHGDSDSDSDRRYRRHHRHGRHCRH